MSDVGTRIPLPSRSLVRPPVDESVSPRAPNPAADTARLTDEAEANASQAVAAHPAVVDTQLHGSYGDAVREHPATVSALAERDATTEGLSHIGYEWETHALCGAPFTYRTLQRPADREICLVCDALLEASRACNLR